MTMISSQVVHDPIALFRNCLVIEDPRIDRNKKYPLVNILFFAFVAILSDQQSWYEIHTFCQVNLGWFSQFFDTSSGVPSHDTFRRVFSLIEPRQLEEVIIAWTEQIRARSALPRVIVLDGKSLRGVAWKLSPSQLHILNAWDANANLFLGQMTIECKTNEITAAPQLLDKLNIQGAVITLDALMTQREIANTIVKKNGNYVMAVKGNQGTLYEEIRLYFSCNHPGGSLARTVEKNRGRVESRTCFQASADWLKKETVWPGLKGIFKIETEVNYEGKLSKQERYYITSLNTQAEELLTLSRSHWSIENQLHRSLDVFFKEDASQEHERNAASNLSILRKIAFSLLKAIDPHKKVKLKMKECSYSPEFRFRCLLGK
jgi:predicted transposase YbfD/YdcC